MYSAIGQPLYKMNGKRGFAGSLIMAPLANALSRAVGAD
jgi:hypothetical protein